MTNCTGIIDWKLSKNNFDVSDYKRDSSFDFWPNPSFVYNNSEIRFYNGNLEDTLKCKNNTLKIDGTIIDIYDAYPVGLLYISMDKNKAKKIIMLSFDYEHEKDADHYLGSPDVLSFPKFKKNFELALDVSKIIHSPDETAMCQSIDNKTIYIIDEKGNIVSKKTFDKPVIVYCNSFGKYWFNGNEIGLLDSETKIKITNPGSSLSEKAFFTEIYPALALYDGKTLHLIDMDENVEAKTLSVSGLTPGTQAGVFGYDEGICYITYDYFKLTDTGVYSPCNIYNVSKMQSDFQTQIVIGQSASSTAGLFTRTEDNKSISTLVVTKYSYNADDIFASKPYPFKTFAYPIKDIPEPIEFAELIMTRDNDRHIDVRIYTKNHIYSFTHKIYE